MYNIVCKNCKYKDGDFNKISKINKIINICKRLEQSEERFQVDNVNTRCKNGMYCNDLKMADKKLNRKLEEIATYIPNIARDASIYHRVLDLLRGDFPITYRSLEAEHKKLQRD